MTNKIEPQTQSTQGSDLERWRLRASTLTEALPFMRRYHGQSIVIKYGGHAMASRELAQAFARDVVMLKQCGVNPVVLHGGGPQIGDMLDRLHIESRFEDGLRRTDSSTMQIAEMVLSGSINKQIVADINQAGGYALGLSGKDCRLIKVRKLTRTRRDLDSNIERVVDLGFVGQPDAIDPKILEIIARTDIIPVIAPIGFDADGQSYNINADTAAGALAIAIQARRLLLLSDVDGILDKNGVLIPELGLNDVQPLIDSHVVRGGMVPKIETCAEVVQAGVDAAVILNGTWPHAIVLELFSPVGCGTLLRSTLLRSS
ncbi:MAG: acetylglutamate kinase [Pseudomonadota bacterium]